MFDTPDMQYFSRLGNIFDDDPMMQMQQSSQLSAPPPPQDPFGSMGPLPMNIGRPAPPDPFGNMGLIQDREQSPMDLMQSMYQPQYTMQNRFNDFLGQMPQREEPSGWRRFGSALYAAGSQDPLKAADQFQNYHYYNKMADWTKQGVPLQQAADNERQGNQVERQFAYGVGQQEAAARRQKEIERRNSESEKDKDLDRELRSRAIDVRERIADNPNLRLQKQNGKLYLVDVNPDSTKRQAPIDTGLPAEPTAEQKAKWGMDRLIAGINARGNVQSDLIDQRAKIAQELAVLHETLFRGRPPKPTSGSGTGTGTGTQSAYQQMQGKKNRVQQIVNMFPGVQSWITVDPSFGPVVKPVGPDGPPDDRTRQMIVNIIEDAGEFQGRGVPSPVPATPPIIGGPDKSNTPAPIRGTNSAGTTGVPEPPRADGKVHVRKKDGSGSGWISPGALDLNIYERIMR